MYICICHAVDEQELRAHIADGAYTTRRIAQRCGAGTGCGMCVRRIACLLGEARASDAQVVVPAAVPAAVAAVTIAEHAA